MAHTESRVGTEYGWFLYLASHADTHLTELDVCSLQSITDGTAIPLHHGRNLSNDLRKTNNEWTNDNGLFR